MSKFYMDYVFKNKIDYKIGKIPYKFTGMDIQLSI